MTGVVGVLSRPAQLGEPALSLDLPAAAESLPLLRQALVGVAAAVGISEDLLDDMKVALTEAASNVILHAYDPRGGPLTVDVWQSAGRVVLRVSDRGDGIRPRVGRAAGAGLGLGLRMIAMVSEEMSIATGEDGTSIWMAFRLDGPGAGR